MAQGGRDDAGWEGQGTGRGVSHVREPLGEESRGGDDDADDGPDGEAHAAGRAWWGTGGRAAGDADAAAGDGRAVKSPWFRHMSEHDPEEAFWPSIVVILVGAAGVGWLWWR